MPLVVSWESNSLFAAAGGCGGCDNYDDDSASSGTKCGRARYCPHLSLPRKGVQV